MMPGEMEREIKDLLGRLIAQRDEDTRDLRAQLRGVSAKMAEMDTKITTLTSRDETISEMRASLAVVRDDVVKLKTQMTIGSVVAAAVLAAVVTLVFRVFANGGV
jgi:predicted RNase H-like nuclease (RuvC/YqgF family)